MLIQNNFKYIRYVLFIPYAFLFISIVHIYLLFKIKHINININIITIILYIIFIKHSFIVRYKAMGKELYRRISKLPIPKSNISIWNKNKNIGLAFIDSSKNTLWFCGTQSKFEIRIYKLEELYYIEYNDYIIYKDEKENQYYVYK